MNQATRRHIADRLRHLLADDNLGAAADRLAVDELSLRMSLDPVSPRPTIEVLVAFVAHYAVDPSYLLTGVYDPAAHRKVMDGDAGMINDCVSQYVQREIANATISRPTPEPMPAISLRA